MKNIIFLSAIMFIITSCDELLNPSSDYVIEKSVIATSEEQVFEAGNDFKIIFPPNAVNQNIELKVKKESSAPTFSLSNMKLGSNLYKLSFKGFQSFAKTVNIYLKYDPSKIESGKTPEQSVKGMIYSNGTWKEANFEIDKVNSRIIFNINNLSSSSLKDEPVFMADDEIIIGDGYTTTDTGQDDDFLAKMKTSKFISVDFSGYHQGLNEGNWYSIHFPLYFNFGSETFTDNLTWDGNKFVAELEGGNISGTINSNNKTLNLQATCDITKIWDDTTSIEAVLHLENVPYDYDRMGMFFKFGKDGGGNNIKNMVKYIQFKKVYKNYQGTKRKNIYLPIIQRIHG
ncbi:hypothetical protein MASR1M45_25540 [Candidatus Kapaibacterium sp.]